LAGLGIDLRSDQFTALVSHVDANGNGVIDYNEFVDDLKNVDAQVDDIFASHEDPRLILANKKAAARRTPTGVGLLGAMHASPGSYDIAHGEIPKIFLYIQEKLAAKRKDIHDVYRHFDENHDQVVTPAELRRGLLHNGVVLSEKNFDELMRIIDADGSGSIDYSEFLGALKAVDRQSLDVVRSLPELPRRGSMSSQRSTRTTMSNRSKRSRQSSRREQRPIMEMDGMLPAFPSTRRDSLASNVSRVIMGVTPSSRQSSSRRFQALP
jgi:Ca2+-binding EF-hand superfamily protein